MMRVRAKAPSGKYFHGIAFNIVHSSYQVQNSSLPHRLVLIDGYVFDVSLNYPHPDETASVTLIEEENRV
jgi:hypothetical protein